MQEEAVVVSEGRSFGVSLGGLDEGIAQLALQVPNHFEMKLAVAIAFYREGAEGARTVALDELSLEDLDCAHEGFIVVGDVSDFFVEEVDGLVGSGELLAERVFGEERGVELFLESDYLLLEDQD